MAEFYTVLTYTGAQKVADALSGGPAVNLVAIAVGDGGGASFYDDYSRQQLRGRTSLVNQRWTDELYLVAKDPDNPAWVTTEGRVPVDVGGWYIREVGIFDAAGDLIAIGVYPETYKPLLDQHVGTDLTVRAIIEVGDADSVTITIDPSVATATRDWVYQQQRPVAAAAELALDRNGIMVKELHRQRFQRHQEGEFVLVNRGRKQDAELSASESAVRNLSISAGQVFMGGRVLGVDEQLNTASVPGNSGSETVTVQAYLHIDGSALRLATTNAGEQAPDDALLLAELTIPPGSTDSTAPYLEDVTITDVARSEPEWPEIQLDPSYRQQDLALPMQRSAYALDLDVVDYQGGEPPRLTKRDADRATNTFRTYLSGSADAVRVRYVAHLMDQ
jgi:NOL1/NOP2/fmu family ribosome biogenesis protein